MSELRGTLIPCDHLTQAVDGKWIIVGTYSNYTHRGLDPTLEIPHTILYVRLETERAMQVNATLRLMDRGNTPLADDAPSLSVPVPLVIEPAHVPIYEGVIVLHGLRMTCTGDRTRGQMRARYYIELMVDGARVAFCPFDVIFPQIPPTTRPT